MDAPNLKYRRTFAQIDLSSIAHNVRAIRTYIARDTAVVAVVKADAYGHGTVPVARTALQAGASMLAVAMAEEAIVLRDAAVSAPILVIGPSNESQMALGVTLGLDLCVFSVSQIRMLESLAAREQKVAKIHLKIDTGMSRIGISSLPDLEDCLRVLSQCPHLHVEGMFTHFACADTYGSQELSHAQHARFIKFAQVVRSYGHTPRLHVSNSAASADIPDFDHDAVRFGISLYGYPPSEERPRRDLKLRKAMQVFAEISHIKTVQKNTAVGYGATFIAPHPMTIATVQIGYGDGYNRLLSNRGCMIVHTTQGYCKAPIVGRVCMDMTMIDITGLEGVRVGDTARAMGEAGGVRFDADDIANLCGTISYEVLLDYTSRVPRIYEEYHG